MNLRNIIFGLTAISAMGIVAVACSSSSTTINNVTDGGGGGGGEGGSGGDSGGGGGGTCATKLADGMYTVTTKATPGNDVDASSLIESALCKDSTSTLTIDSTKDAGSGGTASGCTTMTSSDGCSVTITCTSDMNGTTSNSTTEFKINSDGTFTTTTTLKLTQDDGGAVEADCTTVGTAVKM